MNVVITGASKGIGKTLAAYFAKEKYNLYLCSRNMDKTMGWQKELIAAHGITITSFNADLSSKEEVLRLGNQIQEACSEIDVLINNAGIYEPGSIYNEEDGQLEKMLNVNLLSAYHLTRSLIGPMIKRKSGHIFNICSIAALKAYPNGGSYSISKWALAGFSKNLREELKDYKIKVTTVHPGATLSSSWDGFDIDPKRILETEDLAKMIVAATKLSAQACVEEIVIRPQLGDL